MPVGYGIRKYPFEIDVLPVYERNNKLSRAIREEVLESGSSILVPLLRSAFTIKKRRAHIIFTVEEVTFLKKDGRGSRSIRKCVNSGRRARTKDILGNGGVDVSA